MTKEELKKYEKKPGLWFFPEDFTDESGYDDIYGFEFEVFLENNFDFLENFDYEGGVSYSQEIGYYYGGNYVIDKNKIDLDLEYMEEDGGYEFFQEVGMFNEDCFIEKY